jgi:hypothetical protein
MDSEHLISFMEAKPYQHSFNSIEWIPPRALRQGDPQLVRRALSIPLNGFAATGGLVMVEGVKLSIPLNGFGVMAEINGVLAKHFQFH